VGDPVEDAQSSQDAFDQISLQLQQLKNRTVWGATNGSSALAGQIGEYITATAAVGSVTGWGSGTAQNITSITLTAGDWDVDAWSLFSGGAITGTINVAKISTTTASVGSSGDAGRADTSLVPTATANITLNCPTTRLSLTAPTAVYLCGAITFSGGTPLAGGTIRARRVR
jgi:hypothetical protein